MVTQTVTTNKRTPISSVKLAALADSGYTVRRGTRLYHAFPGWEWQLFSPVGEFVQPIPWRTVAAWGGPVVDGGVNR